jgi:Domain of unknown function (DUF4340)
LRVAVSGAEKKDTNGGSKKDSEKKADAKEKPKEHVLLIGQPTAAGPGTRFAKLGDAEAIFVVDQSLTAPLDRGALDLLDRGLLRLEPETILRIQSTVGDSKLTLERDKDAWRVQSPAAQFTADKEIMDGLLMLFSNLRAEKFAAYGPQANAAQYGFDKPSATIVVSVEGKAANGDKKPASSATHTLILGKSVEQEPHARYARLDNGPGIAVLTGAETNELTRSYLDYVDRNLLQFDPAAVTSIQRKMGADELEIAKRDDGWHLAKPAPFRADDPTIDKLLEQVSHLRAQRVAAYQAKDLKPFGIDAPTAVVTWRLTGPKPTERVLKIGKVVNEKSVEAAPPERYVMADDSSTVAVLDGALANRLLAGALQFRDHILARFADLDKAILERGPRKAVFAKVDGTWKLTEPLQADAEQTELEDLVNALARLRADELIAEKPTDLKPFGLDAPDARWHFLLGDKELLGLAIGSFKKNKHSEAPRCYAKLTNGDLVFLLDPGLTKKLLGEYRNRTVWTSLDSAQVDRIHFGYSQNPFELEKTDNTWHVAGKPAADIKSEKVSETLDALSRLQVERYMVDKNADLKLYGLEPPQFVLEVQSPSGKKTLHIGRAEGTSKRHYARVPEPNRSDVFIISEADADKILRTITDFGK